MQAINVVKCDLTVKYRCLPTIFHLSKCLQGTTCKLMLRNDLIQFSFTCELFHYLLLAQDSQILHHQIDISEMHLLSELNSPNRKVLVSIVSEC